MAVQKRSDNWKLKKWLNVLAPKAFNEAQVGEMPANEEKDAIGRTIVVSLDILTKNPSHAFTNAVLKVTEVNGTTAVTKLIRLEQLYSYVRSLVRRYKSTSSAVVPAIAKDGTRMVFKMLVITRQRAAHSKISGIRKEMTDAVLAYAKENDQSAIIGAVVEGRLQAELAAKLGHIVPLSKVEVRKLEVS